MAKSLPTTEVYSRINHKEPEVLRQAKLTAARYWKFSRDLLFSMRTVPVKGLGTMAVDRLLNLYYDPEYLENRHQAEISSCLLHEMCHIFMGHHRRFHALVNNPTKISREKWNEACDITVNYLLDQEFSVHGTSGRWCEFRVGYDWLMHDRYPYSQTPEITGNQSAEKVFRILMKGISDGQDQSNSNDERSDRPSDTGENTGSPVRFQRETDDDPSDTGESGAEQGSAGGTEGQVEPDGRTATDTSGSDHRDQSGDSERTASDGCSTESDGEPTDGFISTDESGSLVWNGEPIPAPGTGGSGSSVSDGTPRPWEVAGSGGNAGGNSMSEADVDSLVTSACHKAQGDLGNNISFALKDVMRSISKISEDPWSMILRLTRGKLNNFRSRGGKRTYRRLNRRGLGHGVCRPVKRSGKPQLAICLDTSASMMSDDYDKAYSVIKKLLDNLGSSEDVCVITGDTGAKTKVVMSKNVSDNQLRQLQLNGGGGTDVGVLIEDTLEQANPKPDVIVAITDGMTPWPDELKVPVLAVLTQEVEEYWAPPSHITKIILKG